MRKNDRVIELEKKLIDASNDYYNTSTTLVSDDVFDKWRDELIKLNPDSIVLKQIGAPVKNSEWEKVSHDFLVGSLNKINTPEELVDWVKNNAPNEEFFVSEKLDGLSVVIKYINGKAISAALRGDGKTGENILRNAKKMIGFKEILPNNFTGSIRGEIVLYFDNHIKHFSTYANPRNTVSGVTRNLTGDGCEYFNLIFYKVVSDIEILSEEQQLSILKEFELNVPNCFVCKTINDIINLWEDYDKNTRQKLPYAIDGLVVSINNFQKQDALGFSSGRPKGSFAFKFPNVGKETIIQKIDWQVGKMGKICPVATFDQIDLLGSKVSRASLYNLSYIKSIGVDVGAKVYVVKCNEIIPRVEAVIQSTNSIASAPTTCPICNAPTEVQGEFLICTNTLSCPAQVTGRIKNWCCSLNLMEWGTILAEKLVESGKVTIVSDIYKLSVEDLASLDRMGEKSAQKAYDILWNNSKISLDMFLGGLSIPTIGSTIIATMMEAGYDSIDKFMNASINDFEQINSIGSVKAKYLYDGLQYYKEMIMDILKSGVSIKEKQKGKLTGMSFCITGELSKPRDEFRKMIEENGGTWKSSVGKNLSYLVMADPSLETVKAKTAKKNGTKCISEQQLFDLVE